MKEIYDLILLYWQTIKKQITLNPKNANDLSAFGDSFAELTSKYPEASPIRHLAEDLMWSFLHYREEISGVKVNR